MQITEEAKRSTRIDCNGEYGPLSSSVKLSVIQNVLKRIIDAADPEKVILFGSAARGTERPDSDLDVLVVKTCRSRRDVAAKIYRALIGVGRAVDVVVVSPEDIDRYGNSPSMVIEPALREGKVIYAA